MMVIDARLGGDESSDGSWLDRRKVEWLRLDC